MPHEFDVTVTLGSSLGFYEPEFWNTHRYDSVDANGPYADKPKVVLSASYDHTLGEVIDRAADAFDVRPGPDQEKFLIERVSQSMARMGFYLPEDEEGLDSSRVFRWPYLLDIAKETGEVTRVPWHEVTYRELLASAELGLIEGDPSRPYIWGWRPQGSTEVVEAAKVTIEAIRIAYSHLPQAQDAVDNAMRLAFVAGSIKAAKDWHTKRRKRKEDASDQTRATREPDAGIDVDAARLAAWNLGDGEDASSEAVMVQAERLLPV